MVALIRTIGMRDLREKRVFPRILYLVALHELDRLNHKLFRSLVGNPMDLIRQFVSELEARRPAANIILAAGMVLAGLIRAWALLILAVAAFVLTVQRF